MTKKGSWNMQDWEPIIFDRLPPNAEHWHTDYYQSPKYIWKKVDNEYYLVGQWSKDGKRYEVEIDKYHKQFLKLGEK